MKKVVEKSEMEELESRKIPKEKKEDILKEIDKRLTKGESVTVIADSMFFSIGSVMDLAGNIYAGVMQTMEEAPFSKIVFKGLGDAIIKGANGESIEDTEDTEEDNRTEKLLSALREFKDKIEKL